MNTTNPLDVFNEMTDKCKAIMEAKNHDYRGGTGDPYANFRGSEFLGINPIMGILLRIQDKMMRIKTFVEKGELKVKGESIDDALMDTINYCVLIKGLLKEGETNEIFDPNFGIHLLPVGITPNDVVTPDVRFYNTSDSTRG